MNWSNVGTELSLELYLADVSSLPKTSAGHTQTLRSEIRAFIHTNWTQEFVDASDALDLNKRPRGKSKFFSISHCPTHVGVLVSDSPCGLDLEVPDRVSAAIAKRVSQQNAVSEMPSPAHLWVAKESFFKSIPESLQPTTIPELHIFSWTKKSDSLWSFEGKSTFNGVRASGFVNSESRDLIYGVSFQKSLDA